MLKKAFISPAHPQPAETGSFPDSPARPSRGETRASSRPSFSVVRALLVLVLFHGITGCGLISIARITVNEPITQEDVAFIVPGETHLADVIHHLGAPDELMGAEEGAVIAYHFRDLKYSRINFGTLLRFWSPVQPDLVTSGTGLGTDVFQVAFDREWVVQHHAFAKHVPPSTRFIPWPF